MSLKTETKVIVDRSPMHDLLRINFNMTFTKMSCEHLTLDVSDSLGSVRPSLFQKARHRHLQRHSFMVSVGAELPVLQRCTHTYHEAFASGGEHALLAVVTTLCVSTQNAWQEQSAARASDCVQRTWFRLQKKINLSKTVRKVPITSDMSQKGTAMRDENMPMPQYDEVCA